METRLKYRIVVPIVLVLVVLFLLVSQRSRNVQSNNASLIKELRGRLREKEKEIAKLYVDKQRRVDMQQVVNVRKPLTLEPRHVAVRPTLPFVDKITNLRSFNGHKLVHLDLKGAAPKMAYLMKLLPVFKSWGATGLLVEYEDMFPYDGDLSVLKSHYAYSVKEITEFLDEVKNRGLLMVPLVQTFGHMEFVLKHPKFARLRHVANMTTAIDPNNKGSLPLVNMIVAQIIKIHKAYIKYVHIGGDEVWSLKECAGCPPASQLYLKHMIPVIDNVVSNRLTPILWDDMMREWNVEDLKKIASRGAEPMVWAYPPQLDDHFPKEMWQRYSQAFRALWIASAFKGADTPGTNFVPIHDRIENHKSWLKIYSKLSDQNMKVNGIALTGWSRYDHYATLCELLPAGLPSLALCLAVLKEGDLSNQTLWGVSKQLGFKSPIIFNFRRIPRDVKDIDEGKFVGHSVYGIILALRKAYNALHAVESRMSSWFNHRQSVKTKISIFQLTIAFERVESATKRLTELNKVVQKKFSVFYNGDMIEEWIWDKIRSKLTHAQEMKKRLTELRNAAMKA